MADGFLYTAQIPIRSDGSIETGARIEIVAYAHIVRRGRSPATARKRPAPRKAAAAYRSKRK